MTTKAFRFLGQAPAEMPPWVRALQPIVYEDGEPGTKKRIYARLLTHPGSTMRSPVQYGAWIIDYPNGSASWLCVPAGVFYAVREALIFAVEREAKIFGAGPLYRMGDAATRAAINAMIALDPSVDGRKALGIELDTDNDMGNAADAAPPADNDMGSAVDAAPPADLTLVEVRDAITVAANIRSVLSGLTHALVFDQPPSKDVSEQLDALTKDIATVRSYVERLRSLSRRDDDDRDEL